MAATHGYTMVSCAGGESGWRGEFGTCYSTWLEDADCARAKADLELITRLVAKLTKAELVDVITGLGGVAFASEKRDALRLQAQNLQYRAWWPYKFIDSAASVTA